MYDLSKSEKNWPNCEIFELEELIGRQGEENGDVMDDVRALRRLAGLKKQETQNKKLSKLKNSIRFEISAKF